MLVCVTLSLPAGPPVPLVLIGLYHTGSRESGQPEEKVIGPGDDSKLLLSRKEPWGKWLPFASSQSRWERLRRAYGRRGSGWFFPSRKTVPVAGEYGPAQGS